MRRVVREEHGFKQARRGRPGPDTAYRKITKRRFDVQWNTDQDAIAYDRKSDGMYPLLTNDRSLTAAQVLEAHKGQPTIEKRFEQIKTVHEIAPVFLKNEGRIEALFTLYFLALLVQALIERELRQAMAREGHRRATHLPRAAPVRAPHHRAGAAPVQPGPAPPAAQAGHTVQLFDAELTDLQRQILALLAIPESAYQALP